MNKINRQNRKSEILKWLLLGIASLILLSTRLYKLTEVPFGLHVDEAGMAYDAWSLANFGIDRYLNKFPVYFINFGGGQSILYGYLTAVLIKLFGYSIEVIRLPGVIMSFITGYFGFRLVLKYTENQYFAIFYLFIFAISPYFIMQSRFGLDCNLMMGMSCVLLFTLDRMIEKRSYFSILIAGIMSGLILYSYALSYIVIPIFLLFALIYLLRVSTLKPKEISLFIFSLFIIATPLIVLVLVNSLKLGNQTYLFFTIPQLPNYRGSELTISHILPNIRKIIESVLFYDWLPYNAFPQFLTLYPVSIPFVIIGSLTGLYQFVINLKDKKYSPFDLIFLFALAMLVMGILLGGDGPNTNKLNGIFFAISIFLLNGIFTWYLILKRKWKRISIIFIYALISLYLYNFSTFSDYYFTKYPKEINPQYLFTHTYEKEYEYILNHFENERIVYTEPNYVGYIYYLLSSKTPPFLYDIQVFGTSQYLNFRFYLPNDVDEDAIYLVLKNNYSFNENIMNYKMERLEFENYYIYYKKSR